MKLLHAQSINSIIEHDQLSARRIDFVHPLTGEIPPEIGDGPMDEIVRVSIYNGTETLEIEDAATDMNDIDELEHNGRNYRIVEAKRSRQYGFWDSLKCVRALVDGI
jgi:hypothetical protein